MSVTLLRQVPPARRCFHGCPLTEMTTSDHKCASPTEVYSRPHAPPVASCWSGFPKLLMPRLRLVHAKTRCRRRLLSPPHRWCPHPLGCLRRIVLLHSCSRPLSRAYASATL